MSPLVLGLSLVDVLGFVSVVLAVWFAMPQLLKLRRGGSTAGLSLESLANSAISLSGWTVYGLAHTNAWVTLASAAGIPATLATLGLALRAGHRLRATMPATWAAMLVVIAVIDHIFGSHLIDVALGCSILWFVGPAAITAWRSVDVSGVAAQTWLVLAADGVIFGLYGLVADVTADRVYAVTSILGSGVVLARIAMGDRRTAAVRHADLDRRSRTTTRLAPWPARSPYGRSPSPGAAQAQVVVEHRRPRRGTGVEGDPDVVALTLVGVVDLDRHHGPGGRIAGRQHLMVLTEVLGVCRSDGDDAERRRGSRRRGRCGSAATAPRSFARRRLGR